MFFKKFYSKFAFAITRAIEAVKHYINDTYAAVRHLPKDEQGKLENRFHPNRPMGGFRLVPSGKHYRGRAPHHGVPSSRLGAVSI